MYGNSTHILRLYLQYFQHCVTHYRNTGNAYIRETMLELLVNFVSLRTFSHHRTLGHAMTEKGDNPSHTHVIF